MLLRRTVDLNRLSDSVPEYRNVRLEACTPLPQHFVMARSKCRVPPVLKYIYYRIIRPVCETEQTTRPVQNETGWGAEVAEHSFQRSGMVRERTAGMVGTSTGVPRSTQKAIPCSNLPQHWYFSRDSLSRWSGTWYVDCRNVKRSIVDRTVRGVRTTNSTMWSSTRLGDVNTCLVN